MRGISSECVMRLVGFIITIIIIAASAAGAFHQPQHHARHTVVNPIIGRIMSTTSSELGVVFVNIDENCPRDISTMEEWAAACGVQRSDGFQLISEDNNRLLSQQDDVYAITNQNLVANSPIAFIPNDLIITGTKSWQELVASVNVNNNDPTTTTTILVDGDHVSFYLFLKILKEYEMGSNSPWFPWLNSLPRYYSNGASMTDFCFGCLPPYAAQQALEEKTRLKRFELALNEVDDTIISDNIRTNTDLTKWAYNVVHTRYQGLPNGDYCLVPIADYFNHGGGDETTTDAYINFDDDGNCYVYSTRDIPAGQPLRICYGDPTNPSKLLAKYGFLDESSPATFCKWIADEPTSQEIFDLGYPSQMLFYVDGSISNEVWDVLLYQELGKSNPQDQQAFFQACMTGDVTTKQSYHERYFQQTLATLRKHVDFLVNELDELSESSIWKKSTERHPRLPLLMRHNDFIRNIFYLVQQNLDSMG